MSKILVADNEALQRLLLREMLLTFEPTWTIMEAKDGLQALELTQAEKPSVVLLHVRMPRMDGLTVCKLLKADPELCAIPAILLTASSADLYPVEAQEAGCSAYITKPVDDAELLGAIRNAMTWPTDYPEAPSTWPR